MENVEVTIFIDGRYSFSFSKYFVIISVAGRI